MTIPTLTAEMTAMPTNSLARDIVNLPLKNLKRKVVVLDSFPQDNFPEVRALIGATFDLAQIIMHGDEKQKKEAIAKLKFMGGIGLFDILTSGEAIEGLRESLETDYSTAQLGNDLNARIEARNCILYSRDLLGITIKYLSEGYAEANGFNAQQVESQVKHDMSIQLEWISQEIDQLFNHQDLLERENDLYTGGYGMDSNSAYRLSDGLD